MGCCGEQEVMIPPGSWGCTAPLLLPGFRGGGKEPWPHAALGTVGAASAGARGRERKGRSLDLSKSVCIINLSKDIINSQ